MSTGYNPVFGQVALPSLNASGQDATGDFWTVGTVTAHLLAGNLSCTVETVPAHAPDPTRDASSTCVESTTNGSTPPFSYTTHQYVDASSRQGLDAGAIPPVGVPTQWCKH